MGKRVTVSAKVPKEPRDKMHKLNVNISQLIRKAIEKEVKRREEDALRRLAAEASLVLREIPPEEITKIMRETRDQR